MKIFQKMLIFTGLLISGFFMSGCATPVSVSQVMQKPEGTKYYLAHNIWTEGRHSISSINYQRGKILPFGTEVKIVKATKKYVRFKVVSSGTDYTIKYQEQYAMVPIEDYIKTLITTKTREEMTGGISGEFVNAMTRGEVLAGMTRKEVIMTYGPPSPHRTPSQDNPTWVYWLGRWPVSKNSRVIFKGDKVLQIMK